MSTTSTRTSTSMSTGLGASELDAMLRTLRTDITERRVVWEQSLEPDRPTDEQLAIWGEDVISDALGALERRMVESGRARLSDDVEDWLADQLRSRVFGLGGLDALLRDPLIENIVANGCDQVTVTYAGGRRATAAPIADSDDELEELLRRLAGSAGRTERRFDDASPFLDLRLADGSRLHAVKSVTSRPCVSIRRHRFLEITLEQLYELGTIDLGVRLLLAAAVQPPHPTNIVVAGGTDTGKTTFLRGLISEIPIDERLVVIEDNTELQLASDTARARHVVEMETRHANVEGAGEITMSDLLRQSLRMRPDRVIVGEIRGGEAADMFKAMSTGNDGSLTTLHADSAVNALAKMQLYGQMAEDSLSPEASAQLISQSIHLVVHLRKLADGRRSVSSVIEITGAEGSLVHSNELYEADSEGRGRPTGVSPTDSLFERLEPCGFMIDEFLRGAGHYVDAQPPRLPR